MSSEALILKGIGLVKQAEFILSSDNKTWMDDSVISEKPTKVLILDPREFAITMAEALQELGSIRHSDLSLPAIKHVGRMAVMTIMQAVVQRRRAWVYGPDVSFEIHRISLRNLIGYDLAPDLRDSIREDLEDPEYEGTSTLIDRLVRDIVSTLVSRMNPNQFVVHRLSHNLDMKSVVLEEFADWRVIQWTQAQHDTIAARHESN